MSGSERCNHSPSSKAKVVLATVEDEKTLAELAPRRDMHATPIPACKTQLTAGAVGLFGAGSPGPSLGTGADPKTLHAKIGELTLMRSARRVC